MESERLSMAIGGISAEKIEQAGQALGYGKTETSRRGRMRMRTALLIAAVVAAFLALGVTAYAANLWGIKKLFQTPMRELPAAAEEWIQPQNAAARGGRVEHPDHRVVV